MTQKSELVTELERKHAEQGVETFWKNGYTAIEKTILTADLEALDFLFAKLREDQFETRDQLIDDLFGDEILNLFNESSNKCFDFETGQIDLNRDQIFRKFVDFAAEFSPHEGWVKNSLEALLIENPLGARYIFEKAQTIGMAKADLEKVCLEIWENPANLTPVLSEVVALSIFQELAAEFEINLPDNEKLEALKMRFHNERRLLEAFEQTRKAKRTVFQSAPGIEQDNSKGDQLSLAPEDIARRGAGGF
jgi:hypothetical protein